MIPTVIESESSVAQEVDSLVEALAAGDFSRETLRRGLLARGSAQEKLFALARERRDAVWPAREVETRSVIELSNVCQQSCNYCSMAKESKLKRYVIKMDPLLEQVDFLYERGRRVILLQSGNLRICCPSFGLSNISTVSRSISFESSIITIASVPKGIGAPVITRIA